MSFSSVLDSFKHLKFSNFQLEKIISHLLDTLIQANLGDTSCVKLLIDSMIEKYFESNGFFMYTNFLSKIHSSMEKLKASEKDPDLVYKFCDLIDLINIDRMPFGLIEFQIKFFTCGNVSQVLKLSSDIAFCCFYYVYIETFLSDSC